MKGYYIPIWEYVKRIFGVPLASPQCDCEKKRGEGDPTFQASLTNETKALRKLGRNDEAEKLEQRSAKIQKTSASAN